MKLHQPNRLSNFACPRQAADLKRVKSSGSRCNDLLRRFTPSVTQNQPAPTAFAATMVSNSVMSSSFVGDTRN